MLEAELAFAGVAGQSELLRRGEVSSRELVELALARIDVLDSDLNAFGAVYANRAREDADRADRRRAAGEDAPLLGVPVAVKDEIDLAGEVTSRGTGAFTARAIDDAEVVRRLRAGGAVVVGKTRMPELGLWPFTESVTWGVTRNPWDVERTPGGSSGGSAAAVVAAGMVPAAIGRGWRGLDPHPGGLHRPVRAQAAERSRAADAARPRRQPLDRLRGADALGDRHGHRPRRLAGADARPRRAAPRAHAAVRRRGALAPGSAAHRRLLRVSRRCQGPSTPEVRGALDATVDVLRGLGHTVVEQDVDFRPRDVPVILGLLFRAIHDFVGEVERPARLERRSRAYARPGMLVADRTRERLLAAERRMAERVGRLFVEHDVLLTPVMSQPAVPTGLMEGRGATVTYEWATGWVPFNVLWNATGQPAASVPAGFSAAGLPLAVQIVGRPNDEATLLSLAAQLETAQPWADHRPATS